MKKIEDNMPRLLIRVLVFLLPQVAVAQPNSGVAMRAQEVCKAHFEAAWNYGPARAPGAHSMEDKNYFFGNFRKDLGANEGCGGNPKKLQAFLNSTGPTDQQGAAIRQAGICVQRFLASPQCKAGAR